MDSANRLRTIRRLRERKIEWALAYLAAAWVRRSHPRFVAVMAKPKLQWDQYRKQYSE